MQEIISMIMLTRSSESSEQNERSSYWQSYTGHLDDIQSVLKHLINIGKYWNKVV